MLRIEDTDRERSTPENVEQILDALRWLDLDWDEGPIFQTAARRAPRRGAGAAAGRAVTPTTPPRPPRTSRAYKERARRRPRLPRRAGGRRRGAPARARRRRDGRRRRDPRRDAVSRTRSMDDPVIARADGSALYNFAVAVDDLDAGITHVVRGEDHLSNTPKQLLVFEALGAPAAALRAPAAAARARRQEAVQAPRRRLGAGAARRRLPARGGRQLHRAARRGVRRRRGVLHAWPSWPSASGSSGSPRTRPCSTSASCATSTAAICASSALDELTRRLEEFTGRTGLRGAVEISAREDPDAGRLLAAGRRSCSTARSTIPRRFAEDDRLGDGGVERWRAAREALAEVEPFDAATVEAALRGVVEAAAVKPGKVFQPVRVAIAGTTVSPGSSRASPCSGARRRCADRPRARPRA